MVHLENAIKMVVSVNFFYLPGKFMLTVTITVKHVSTWPVSRFTYISWRFLHQFPRTDWL